MSPSSEVMTVILRNGGVLENNNGFNNRGEPSTEKKPKLSGRKCLFGAAAPDAEGIAILLEEQRAEDRLRIFERFGFDIDDIENVEHRKLSSTSSAKKRKRGSEWREGVTARKRRLFIENNSNTTVQAEDKENVAN